MPRSMLHATLLLLLASGPVACSGWRHGASLYEYKDQVLKVDGGRGAERLRLEAEYDSTIANWLAQNGEPDYIHVRSSDSVDLCYLAEDRVVTFTRAGAQHSIAAIAEPIPEPLQRMFVHADRQRLAAQRGEEALRLAAPAPSSVPAPAAAAAPAAVHEVPAAAAEPEVLPIQPEEPPAAASAAHTCPPCEQASAAPAPQAAAKPRAKQAAKPKPAAAPAKPAEHAKPEAAPHDAPHP